MNLEKKKALLKKYLETVKISNERCLLEKIPFSGYCVLGYNKYRKVDISEPTYYTFLPKYFLILGGPEKAEEIKKQFTDEELITIIDNLHLAGDLIEKEKEYNLSPKTPIKNGEVTDPFYRMFNEIQS